MARLLCDALRLAGHAVTVLSTFRSFMAVPDAARAADLDDDAAHEVARLTDAWRDPAGRPDAVLAYHLHYKAPDLVGLPLARRFALPYLTAEASHARKRDDGPWRARQALVAEAVRAAAVNLCFTANDRAGLSGIAAPESLVDLPPFIDAGRFRPGPQGRPKGQALITVAMMRPGDKTASYRLLADALSRLTSPDWHLTIVGDGPARAEIGGLFAAFPDSRVRFAGALDGPAIAGHLRAADVLVWPGFNEAFGLCYLEAQACGLPAVAITGEGTPSVIRHGETGWLTPPDAGAFAAAIDHLLGDEAMRATMGTAAARFVHGERGLPPAAARLDAALRTALHRQQEAETHE
jgi:glycosyltransferase involved in cell wall biosynthesis